MMRSHLLLLLASLVVQLMVCCQTHEVKANYSNRNVNRIFTLSSRVGVRSATVVEVSPSSSSSSDKRAEPYVLTLPAESVGGRVAYMQCEIDKKPVTKMTVKSTPEAYRVEISAEEFRELRTGFVVSCDSVRVGRESRRPLPESIPQTKKQFYFFEGDYLKFASPYPTVGEETTIIHLPTTKIESRLHASPDSVTGKTVTYGPYPKDYFEKDPSAAKKRLAVHYEHDSEVPVFTWAEREIEISHWGAASVEEFFELRHDGAKLEGFYSRLDHDKKRPGVSFQHMYGVLPARAEEVYYRDAVGNVTTSSVIKKKTATDFLIQLRFPMYGGWKTQWYDGYQVPFDEFVTPADPTADEVFTLEVPVQQSFRAVLTEKLTIKAILPPGAYDYKIASVPQFNFVKSSVEQRKTFLDFPWTPRPVIVLEFRDVIAADGSLILDTPGKIRITYRVPSQYLALKPLSLSMGIFAVLVALLIFSRVFSSSSSSEGSAAAAAATTTKDKKTN